MYTTKVILTDWQYSGHTLSYIKRAQKRKAPSRVAFQFNDPAKMDFFESSLGYIACNAD